MKSTPKLGAYGLTVYNGFKEVIYDTIKNNDIINITSFYVLYEHKKCMLQRLNALNQYTCINFQIEYNEFKKIENNIKKLINLCLKYNFTKDISILYRIQSIIELTKKDLRGTSDA